MARFKRIGILCIVSGPSGVGKTTLCKTQAQRPGFVYSISCTTRMPRAEEINGLDYYFLSRDEFRDRIKRKQFLEYAKVHGHYYGTLKSTVLGLLTEGTDVLLDIDVQGARAIRKNRTEILRRAYMDVFVMPPSLKELHARLSGRGDTMVEDIELRMDNAREEMRHWKEYQYVFNSDTPQRDRASLGAILEAERYRTSRLMLPSEKRK